MILHPPLSLLSPPLKPPPSLTLCNSLSSPPPPPHHYHHHHFNHPKPLSLPAAATATTTEPGLQFRRKLLYLSSLNIDPQKALRLNPSLRSSPLSSLLAVEHSLSSLGLPRASLSRILDMYPQLLTSDPHSHIYPVLDFLLHDVALPFAAVPLSLHRCPRLLVSDLDLQLRPALRFLRRLGFRSIDPHATVLLVSSVDRTLIPKLDFLRGYGFSDSEVANMAVRSPGILTYSVENNLRPKMEFFVNDMRGELTEIRRFPQYFSFSLEKKIKPRHRALAQQGLSMPLPEMLKVSDGEFHVRVLELRLRVLDR